MPSTEKKETKVLLALMAHEIFHREMEIDTSAVDWMSVLAEAGRHKVTALLYPTIRELDGCRRMLSTKHAAWRLPLRRHRRQC